MSETDRTRCTAVAAIACVTLPWLVPCETSAEQPTTEPDVNADVSPNPWRQLQHVARDVPTAGPDHPGNVFQVGQEVRVRLPAGMKAAPSRWRALDDRLTMVAQGEVSSDHAGRPGTVRLGTPGIGWYRVEFLDADGARLGWTTAAVLARLACPVPQDSPVCLDAAISWLGSDDPAVRAQSVHLAALAGVNWIRDRLRWREVQPKRNTFIKETKYDALARMQKSSGLKVLQTFHTTPSWAAGDDSTTARFPTDLREAYKFCKAMSVRFRGRVQAWEPWNEANAGNFGGHTIDEMCAYQKASYLGFKAGDPSVTVCWNACGGINTPAIAKGVLENRTWPYFDVYSIHSYDWPHAYRELWGPAREAASGRPIWVTECDRGMKASTGPPWGDFSHDDARRKAEFMAQSYANSLYAGANRHFHFILGHYMEAAHTVQFGLLRLDRTPRISYVALAAVGRFLAGARCLGRWRVADQPDTYVYAFRSRPDGHERDVLVAWTEKPTGWPQRGKASVEWRLPGGVSVESVFDYLGRPIGSRVPSRLTSAAIFVLLPFGQADRLPLETVPLSTFRRGAPSPVVMQLSMPRSATVYRKESWTPEHERSARPGEQTPFRICVYNFGAAPVSGVVSLDEAPAGWQVTPKQWRVSVGPMGREVVSGILQMPDEQDRRSPPQTRPAALDNWFRFKGDFGSVGDEVMAFRVIPRTDSK